MWTLIRNGGVIPMSFILLFGGAALLAAFYFAVRAERRTLGFVRSMSQATLFATLAATCSDIGATLYATEKVFSAEGTTEAVQAPHAAHLVVEGFAESTSPGILGFSFLGMTAMLVAVGRRRVDEREAV
jgi:hypothetical protein